MIDDQMLTSAVYPSLQVDLFSLEDRLSMSHFFEHFDYVKSSRQCASDLVST